MHVGALEEEQVADEGYFYTEKELRDVVKVFPEEAMGNLRLLSELKDLPVSQKWGDYKHEKLAHHNCEGNGDYNGADSVKLDVKVF